MVTRSLIAFFLRFLFARSSLPHAIEPSVNKVDHSFPRTYPRATTVTAPPTYKICIVSSHSQGGAGNAARRLHQGFLQLSVDSCFFTTDNSARVEECLVYRPGRGIRSRSKEFSASATIV